MRAVPLISRRIERPDALVAAEDKRRTRRRSDRVRDDFRRRVIAAGERDADGVQNADFRPTHGVRRQIFIAQRGDAFSQALRQKA